MASATSEHEAVFYQGRLSVDLCADIANRLNFQYHEHCLWIYLELYLAVISC